MNPDVHQRACQLHGRLACGRNLTRRSPMVGSAPGGMLDVPGPGSCQRTRAAGVALKHYKYCPRARQHHASPRPVAGSRAARKSSPDAGTVDFLRALVGVGCGECAAGLARLPVGWPPRRIAQPDLGDCLCALVAVAGRRGGGTGGLAAAAHREPGWLYNSAPLRNGQPDIGTPKCNDRQHRTEAWRKRE